MGNTTAAITICYLCVEILLDDKLQMCAFSQDTVETGITVETNNPCSQFAEIVDSKLKITMTADQSLPNIFNFRTTNTKHMPLDPTAISNNSVIFFLLYNVYLDYL